MSGREGGNKKPLKQPKKGEQLLTDTEDEKESVVKFDPDVVDKSELPLTESQKLFLAKGKSKQSRDLSGKVRSMLSGTFDYAAHEKKQREEAANSSQDANEAGGSATAKGKPAVVEKQAVGKPIAKKGADEEAPPTTIAAVTGGKRTRSGKKEAHEVEADQPAVVEKQSVGKPIAKKGGDEEAPTTTTIVATGRKRGRPAKKGAVEEEPEEETKASASGAGINGTANGHDAEESEKSVGAAKKGRKKGAR